MHNTLECLIAQIGFIVVAEISAKQYWYHESCRKDYTRPMKQLSQDVQKYNQAYMQLVTFVEQVVAKKGNGVLFETIQEKYKSVQENQDVHL